MDNSNKNINKIFKTKSDTYNVSQFDIDIAIFMWDLKFEHQKREIENWRIFKSSW